ncbi:hypothetical protein A2U01_0089933, partial [Trifolium medium]|nr:hypothetical protein [Trifolium medium]
MGIEDNLSGNGKWESILHYCQAPLTSLVVTHDTT